MVEKSNSSLTCKQVTDRMVAALRRAHATPPKEQKDLRLGKPSERLKRARTLHFSDCEVNNAPAFEPGRCTCGGLKVGR